MAGKRRLLAAVTDLGFAHVRRALGGQFELVPAFSLAQAQREIEADGIEAILCSIHFDESRMFDLLHFARHAAPGTPFICCRLLHSSKAALGGLTHAAEIEGAAGFIDYSEMQRRDGSAAGRAFCDAVMALLSERPEQTAHRRQN